MSSDSNNNNFKKHFYIQIVVTVLIALLTPILTMVGVKSQLEQEHANWSVQREIIRFEKLQEQKIQSFEKLNYLLAKYRRAYRNNMHAQYFGSLAPAMANKDLALADLLPEQKDELELRALETSKGELWSSSLKNREKAMDEYTVAVDALTSHLQSSIFFFSEASRGHIKEFSDYILVSFVKTWPKLNFELILDEVVEGQHSWKAFDLAMEADFKNFSESELNDLQNKMIQQLVMDIYSESGIE